jgi:acetyl esterase/lipase
MRPDGSEQRKIDSVSGGGPSWSPSGEQIAFHSAPLDQAEITVMNPDGSDQRPLTDNEAQDWWPDWSPDGSQIAFMSDRDGNFEIYVMDVHNSTNQRRLTFNDGDDWRPRWSPDGAWIAFVSMQDGNYEIYLIRPDGSDQQRLTDNGFSDIQVSWRPAVGDLPSDERTPQHATPFASVIPFSFDTIKDISYLADEQAVHKLDLYLPQSKNLPLPTLLALHGGGGDKGDMRNVATHFAQRGYAVVSANFREGRQVRYPAPVQDAFCALAWVHAHADTYQLDPERIFALGFSLGGTLAGMLGTVDDSSLYLEECSYSLPDSGWVQGVATFTGVFDLANSSGPLLAYYSTYIGAAPEEDPGLWAEASPIGWLDGREPPFLLVHGELDGNIDPSHSADFAAALEEVSVPVELLIVPGTGHMTLIRSDAAYDAVEIFIAEPEP